MIIFRPKIVFLDTDSILRVKTMYESVKEDVLNNITLFFYLDTGFPGPGISWKIPWSTIVKDENPKIKKFGIKYT